jgi:hypothetical protein
MGGLRPSVAGVFDLDQIQPFLPTSASSSMTGEG